MKRSFSLQDLGNNAGEPNSDSSTVENIDTASPTSLTGSPPDRLSTMQRSKSMNALQNEGDEADQFRSKLPSILSLGLSSQNLNQVHGLEVLKRGACTTGSGAGMTSLPRSLSNSSLSQLTLQDDDIGAATALMELCGSGQNMAARAAPGEDTDGAEQLVLPSNVVSLPSLRELLGDNAPGMKPVSQPHDSKPAMTHASMYASAPAEFSSSGHDRNAAIAKAFHDFAAANGGAGEGEVHVAAARRISAPAFRNPKVGGGTGNEDGESQDGKHNKYCHFCQHVKVKRATSMLACENSECARRFCEHCLKSHLSEVVPSDGKGISELVDGKWLCPICRKVCCCALISCDKKHRHCKAFRYRQRRAQQAARRNSDMANENARGKLPTPAPFGPGATRQEGHGQLWMGYGGGIEGGFGVERGLGAAHLSAIQAHFVGMENLQSLHSVRMQNQSGLPPSGQSMSEGMLAGRHASTWAAQAQGMEKLGAGASFLPFP